MTRFITFFIILFLSCNSSTKNNDVRNINDTTQENHRTNTNSSHSDTLREPSHYYYLADLPLKQIGHLILKDSIQPTDNHITFDCMDSLSSEYANTRDNFFPVFIKIMEKSDGALAEAVGQYAMTYVEKYPGEFAQKSLSMTVEQFNSWASFTGFELYYAYDTEKKAKRWASKVNKNCSPCDSVVLKRLDEFNKLAIAAMKDVD